MARIVRNSSSNLFNSFLNSSLISALITFAMGIIIYFFADVAVKLINFLIAAVLIWGGINSLLKYLRRDGAKLYSYNMIFSIIMLVLGVVVCLVPTSVTSFVMVIVALYLIVLGANKISYGAWLKVGNDSSWLITIVIGIFISLLGILIMANPFEATLTAFEVIGIFFMLSAVLDFSNIILLKKRKDEINKIFW